MPAAWGRKARPRGAMEGRVGVGVGVVPAAAAPPFLAAGATVAVTAPVSVSMMSMEPSARPRASREAPGVWREGVWVRGTRERRGPPRHDTLLPLSPLTFVHPLAAHHM